MKTFYSNTSKFISALFLLVAFILQTATAQTCANPNTLIYGITASGDIRQVNVNTAAVGAAMNTASGNAANTANGLGYNALNGMFYYFKRNAHVSNQEFVSFDPSKDKTKVLADCPTTYPVRTGCVSFNGAGFYALDAAARLFYYDILLNKWTLITSTFYNSTGSNITSVFTSLNSGDIAIDGLGNLWILCSNDDNYGLYVVEAPLPTTAVSRITCIQKITPTRKTPTGSTFVGIAFNPSGQIYATTYADDRLYRLENNLTLSYIGKLSVANAGNDLTSCSFPMSVLPITLTAFNATADNRQVKLSWTDAAKNDNPGYEIEHSTDEKNWEKIGFVQAGTTEKYAFNHSNPTNGDHYYRIKQTDLNGAVTYSAIRMATIKTSNDVAVWPNPAKNVVYVNSNMSGTLRLFDAFGRAVYSSTMQQGVNTINVNNLPTGTYIVHMASVSGQVQTRSLIKQ